MENFTLWPVVSQFQGHSVCDSQTTKLFEIEETFICDTSSTTRECSKDRATTCSRRARYSKENVLISWTFCRCTVLTGPNFASTSRLCQSAEETSRLPGENSDCGVSWQVTLCQCGHSDTIMEPVTLWSVSRQGKAAFPVFIDFQIHATTRSTKQLHDSSRSSNEWRQVQCLALFVSPLGLSFRHQVDESVKLLQTTIHWDF